MSVSLGSVGSDDEPCLFDLHADTRKDELDTWGFSAEQRQMFLKQQFTAQRRPYDIQFPASDHQIILKDGRPIGRILVHCTADKLRLVDISLLADRQRTGTGTRLTQRLVDETTEAAKSLRLHVLRTSRVLRLYGRLGFTTTGDDGLCVEMKVPGDLGLDSCLLRAVSAPASPKVWWWSLARASGSRPAAVGSTGRAEPIEPTSVTA